MKKKQVHFEEKGSEKSFITAIKDILGLIGAVAGLFAALLWLGGRSFAAGYFGAMNMPSYQVTFSIWEYAEVAWLPLIFAVAVLTIIISVITGVVLLLAKPIMMFIFDRLDSQRKKKNSKEETSRSDDLNSSIVVCFYIAYWGLFSLFLVFGVREVLDFIKSIGQDSGRGVLLEHAQQLEFVSVVPQALGTPTLVAETNGTNLFEYDGFQLLTYNNGKYYFFKEIDPITCKPKQVYIMDEEQFMQINLEPAISIINQCGTPIVNNSSPTAVPP